MLENKSRQRERENRREPLLMITGILMCLTLVSVFLACGVLAKYRVESGGSDEARVAKFGELVMVETGDDEIALKPDGKPIARTMKVSFPATEVATQVSVTVSAPSWTVDDAENPTTFSISNGTKALYDWTVPTGWTTESIDTTTGTYVFAKTLAPNVALAEETFLNGIANHVLVSDTMPATAYTLQFTAKAEQID